MSQEPNIKTLFYTSKKDSAKKLLDILDSNDLFALAQTASKQRIIPLNRDEAIDAILIYTVDCKRLLSYKKITNQVLIQYLISNNHPIQGHPTRIHLITNVLKLWDEIHLREDYVEPTRQTSPLLENPEKNNKYSSTYISSSVSSVVQHTRSDDFARDFSEWFYICLNNVHKDTTHTSSSDIMQRLDPTMFCENSSLDIYMITPTQENSLHSETNIECEKSLRDVIIEHKLLFSPNLDKGTCAKKSSHGLIQVLCCGTLHQANNFVGIFEQEFGLVMNPIDKLWKIFYTKINLKQATTKIVPCLPGPSEIFEIES